MIDRVAAHCRKQLSAAHIVRACSFCLPVIAVVQACYISCFLKMPIPIEQPVVLVFGALFAAVRLRGEAVIMLQRITSFYLISVPVSQLSAQYFSFSFWRADVSVSHSTVVLSLAAAGYFLGRVSTSDTSDDAGKTDVIIAWLFALAIIVIHMVFLTIVLMQFFGYGYERNLSVLGNLALYFLLFLALWRNLGVPRFRQCVGLVLTIFYLAVSVASRGLA